MIHYTKIVFVILTQMICFSPVIFGAERKIVVHRGVLVKDSTTGDMVLDVCYPNEDGTNLKKYSENIGKSFNDNITLGSFIKTQIGFCKIATIQYVNNLINHNDSAKSYFDPISTEEVKKLELEKKWEETQPIIEQLMESLPKKTVRNSSFAPKATEEKVATTPKTQPQDESFLLLKKEATDKSGPVESFSWSKMFGGSILFIVFIACVWKFTTR